MDVSHNPALITLSCGYMQVTRVDLSKNAVLKNLYCNDCQLTSLDISHNPELREVSCQGNKLTKLDVSASEKLTDLVRSNKRIQEKYGYDHWSAGTGNNRCSLYVDSTVTVIAGSFISEPTAAPEPVLVGSIKYGISGSTAVAIGPKSKNVKELIIPATVKVGNTTYKVTGIGADAFKGMKKLATVEIGKNVKIIGKNAFNGCVKLKKLTGMDGVTKIEASAFQNCKELPRIIIPAKVKDIGAKAFYGCAKLKTIIIKTKKLTATSVGEKAFKGVYKKATVQVPASKLKDYMKLLVKKGLPETAIVKK